MSLMGTDFFSLDTLLHTSDLGLKFRQFTSLVQTNLGTTYLFVHHLRGTQMYLSNVLSRYGDPTNHMDIQIWLIVGLMCMTAIIVLINRRTGIPSFLSDMKMLGISIPQNRNRDLQRKTFLTLKNSAIWP